MNGLEFFPTFVGRSLNKCRAKVEQKLDQVLKEFQHDPTFWRTKEKSHGQKFDPIQAFIPTEGLFLLVFLRSLQT